MPLSDYVHKSNVIGIMPKDQFGHKAFLLQRDEDYITSFQKLANKQILMANLNEKIIRLYQNDILILTELFSASVRDSALFPFFEELYYGWIGELNMTRTIKGKEADAQYEAGKYRKDYPGYSQEQAQQEEQTLFDKLRSRGNQQERQ